MKLDRNTLYDKMYGCWLGKNIGGTLGTPLEGQKNPEPLPLAFPDKNEPNDDLDLQLAWLDMIRRKGLALTLQDFADCWRDHVNYPMDEYGIARANIKRGILPPLTGQVNNFFKDCMGSPIRSEIWGCLCAGKPAQAAYYAQCDALVDHYDEGVYGEILFAVMESLAFIESDPVKITRDALDYLPTASRVYEAVQLTVDAYLAKMPLEELREELVKRYGDIHANFTYCVTNIAFTVAGVLYCEMDFLKSMVWSINLGFDTDCTGATAGSIIGIIKGFKAIQAEYPDVKFDTRIIAGWGVHEITVPPTIQAMTEELIELNAQLSAMPDVPELAKHRALPIPPACKYHLHRRFLLANTLPEVGAAQAALAEKRDFVRLDLPTDTFEFAPFLNEGMPLYLATVIEFTRAGKYRIHPHADASLRYWIDGVEGKSPAFSQYAPSPHRCEGSELTFYPAGTRLQVLVELREKGIESLFALLVSDEKLDHEISAEFRFAF